MTEELYMPILVSIKSLKMEKNNLVNISTIGRMDVAT